MAAEFYEVLLRWQASGPDPHVREWLEKQGLTAIPMKAGTLTVASPSQIEELFGVSVEAVVCLHSKPRLEAKCDLLRRQTVSQH
jgi:hypothetical protein